MPWLPGEPVRNLAVDRVDGSEHPEAVVALLVTVAALDRLPAAGGGTRGDPGRAGHAAGQRDRDLQCRAAP